MLYDLKKVPKQWHERFDWVKLSYGFRKHESGVCVFMVSSNEIEVWQYVYADDMLIGGTILEYV